MARPFDIQRKRARRGRRRKRRPELIPTEAFSPRCRSAKWVTKTHFKRRHHLIRKWHWTGKFNIDWEPDEHES